MNLNLSPTYFAEIGGFTGREIENILIPIAGIILGGIIVVTGMYFHHRRRELWHQTARLALEKGQPVPSLPDGEAPNPNRRHDENNHDFRAGLVLVATGAGLYVFLGTFLGRGLGYVGAIPGFIGVALILNGFFGTWRSKHKTPPTDRPPQS